MVLPRKVTFQVVYRGPEGPPEFVDIRGSDEEDAVRQAAEWCIHNAAWLRECGNHTVRLIRIVGIFGLPDLTDKMELQES